LEQSQDPTSQNNEIERFYYNQTYGVRLSIKPFKNARFYLSRQESEQKDLKIKNHTTGFGFSVYNLLKTGISLYGNYNMNRGDSSESDTYYISASRSFGKVSWSLSYANYYNGVRFTVGGTPEIVRILLPDQQTYSTDLFLILNRWLAFSLDYSYLAQTGSPQHQFFVRLIIRK
jgi:outer membrane usher protein FimD/PapC